MLVISLLLFSNGAGVSAATGVALSAPSGYVVSNIDPLLNSTQNNEIYDPNFIPGFGVGLTNTSISWSSGIGYGRIGYSIGPLTHEEDGIPHFAVGPQCCNFVEVPRTQQFRDVSWGDYYYVRAGLGAPGVNVANYTSDFTAPAYVGLRTDWNWTVRLSLDWTPPRSFDPGHTNEWAAIGIAATQYVPNAPGKLVYTVLNFWMDSNSSSRLTLSSTDGIERMVVRPNVVVYHPLQLSSEQGNETLTLDLSRYLKDTLEQLGISPATSEAVQAQPPVLSYVYLNVEGYNFAWDATLWSLMVLTDAQSLRAAPASPVSQSTTAFYLALGAIVMISSVSLVRRFRRRSAYSSNASLQRQSGPPPR